MIEYRVIIDW